MPPKRLEELIHIRGEKYDGDPAPPSLSFLSLQIAFVSTRLFSTQCSLPLTLSVTLPFAFSLSVITVIFPLTTSDYPHPLLVITFYFKSTQPPDLSCFRLLFGSTAVIKMLPGSSSLLSKVSFLSHRAIAIQHFSPVFSSLPTHFFLFTFPTASSSFSCFSSLSICLFQPVTHALFFCIFLSHSPTYSGCFNNCGINILRQWLNTQFAAG